MPNARASDRSPAGYIIAANRIPSLVEVGRKAHALASLKSAGFRIPDWCVLSPRAFDDSLTDVDRALLAAAARGSGRPSLLPHPQPAGGVRAQLEEAVRQLCPAGERVAVRSSGVDEDDARRSFAGQFESRLCVKPEHVPACVAEVWQSAFSERNLSYRRGQGLPFPDGAPAVMIQHQIDADAAGVAFGADPVSGRRSIAVVAAVRGLGSSLVSGECDSDTFHVAADGRIVARTIATKSVVHRCAADGTQAVSITGQEMKAPALDDDQVVAVADLVRRAGRHFGAPQDIEWAISRGHLFLLQSRPITSLRHIADPDAALNIWDNSNVAESYPGITSPLTFSFVRHVYEEVYREFCRLVGVPSRVIAAHDDTFGRMLGLVRGRVYYNLLSWYRLLSTLPGFTLNRRFMEQMMGVAEGVPDHVLGPRAPATVAARALDAVRLGRTTIGLTWNGLLLPHRVRRFRARLAAALGSADANLTDRRPDEIVAHYRTLERQLLKRWDAPLLNDFFAMVFYGVLRRLTEKWCGDRERTLQNDLVAGEGGLISTEPARRVREMARIASTEPVLVAALCEGSLDDISAATAEVPAFRTLFEEYLDTFADRCFEELKLESPTLTDDPMATLRSIGQLARRGSSTGSGEGSLAPHPAGPTAARAAAEARVRDALAGKPLRRVIFGWVLGQARARVRDRENLRFDRTRVFGRVRKIVLRLGHELVALGVLNEAEDVFYLHVDELLGFVEGTTVSTDLEGLARLRRLEYVGYASLPVPDDRFETRGVVYVGNSFGKTTSPEVVQGDERTGIGCCPGSVEARVSVVRDPRQAVPADGTILVAERTDPAWVVLFSSAAGLLVERGSLLSHSAIIAREMGLPTIIAVPNLTRWLHDGDCVRMDGRTGRVFRVNPDEEHGHAG